MKTNSLLVIFLSIFSSTLAFSALAQGTSFIYQGRLNNNGTPTSGSYDLQFALYDAATGGSLVGGALTTNAVPVSNGLFTVTLDFGAGIFPGAGRWLNLSVKTNSAGGFTSLTPRQPLTSAPYAIYSANAGNANSAASAASVAGPNITGTISDAQLSANVPLLTGGKLSNSVLSASVPLLEASQTFTGAQNFSNPGNSFAGNGGGLVNVPGTLTWQTVNGTTQQAAANTGYVITNNGAQVTVTLPPSPAVGDVVRISGAGAGGWKIAQNVGQTILGQNFSVIGGNWTPRENNRTWFGVASSADGTKLVAGDFVGYLYTSGDAGVTWTARASSRQWYGLASSADGSKLVAGHYGGQIYTSTDSGANWTPHDTNRTWRTIASSADGTKLVAGIYGGQLYTSTDSGTNWTARESSRTWYSVASSSDGSRLVAVVGGGQIYTSVDSGTNWTARENSRVWASVASSADGYKLVAAVYGGQIYTSTDAGTNWTPHGNSDAWQTIALSTDGNRLIAAVNGGQIYISADGGLNWTAHASSRSWYCVASSADGNSLVAGVNGGQLYTSNPSSGPVPVTTTAGPGGYLLGGPTTAVELQYVGNNQFLVLSWAGTIFGY